MDWVVTIIGVIGFYLAGQKVWWAWYVNIANQVLWAVFAVVTEQWGFLIGIPLYMSVFVKNAVDWTKEHKTVKRRKDLLMFTKIGADIPLNIPGEKNPIHANLALDAVEGTIHLKSVDSQFKAVNYILDVLRANNLLAMELNLKYIEADASNIPDSFRGK